MFRVLLLASLVPLSIAQLTSSCTTCGTNNYGSSSGSMSYNNQNSVQRDSGSSGSSNQPGYLPDYQGDRYTDPQRIAETQALNRAFFDSIGGAPSPPPETPAQQGMNSGSSTQSPTGSTSYGNNQMTQNSQNFVAYDSVNQNSPYYYQRVPSTAQYNSVLGVNAGFPNGNNNQVMYDSTTGGYGSQQYGQGTYSNQQNMGAQGGYQQPQQQFQNQAMYNPSGIQGYSNQQYSNQQYSNQQYNTQDQQQYGSSTVSPQYSQDSISCCSQVSSTCCYQTQAGNNLQYSPSVYQYGRKK